MPLFHKMSIPVSHIATSPHLDSYTNRRRRRKGPSPCLLAIWFLPGLPPHEVADNDPLSPFGFIRSVLECP
jgi:hypothetical protein